MKRLILAVTGMPGSGKSVVSSILSKSLDCPVISMGNVVREEVKRRGLPLEPEIIERVAKRLREEKGPEAVALMVLDKVNAMFNLNERCVIIDGARSINEIRTFSRIGKVCVVAVHSSPSKRLERLLSRGREGDVKSEDEFIMRDKYNLDLGIGNLIALADFMIINESSLDDLEKEVKKLVGELSIGSWRNCGRGRD